MYSVRLLTGTTVASFEYNPFRTGFKANTSCTRVVDYEKRGCFRFEDTSIIISITYRIVFTI